MPDDTPDLHGAPFLGDQIRGLYEPSGPRALAESAERSTRHNQQIAASIPSWQEWREAANQIKHYAVANLDKLLIEFERSITARGATVLWAEDAEQANRHVLEIARQHGVKTVVKSKSMVTEELELNAKLEAAGIRTVETDLGEYLVQLAGQRPTHIVTPALHLSAEDVGRLFAEKLGEPFTAEHAALTATARKHLRQEFIRAEMGISGVNFAIADTGTLCVVENEGNAGLATSAPPVHVALMGIEKVIPSIEYLPQFLNLLARSGTGQKLTTYTHLFHGATPGQELYVIILDNGRTRALADAAARMSLFCIRCGACLNACPVYRRTGGWAYGWVYPGPIGAALTPHLVGLRQAGTLPFASSLCGACGEVCPVGIDLPHQLVHLRHRAVSEPSPMRSWRERLTWRLWAWAMRGPLRYALAMGLIKTALRAARWLPWHPGKLGAWTRGRGLPHVPPGSFRRWWRRHGEQFAPAGVLKGEDHNDEQP
ncbi:MAG TPA: lactate utilization protein [Planctomycetaceae bacterium]|nr:lactate utilization protein [Planctomycetaceae bacterium]